MWTTVRRGSAWLGTLHCAEVRRRKPRGGAARAHKGAAGSWKYSGRAAGPADRGRMGSATVLARRLRAALREEELRAVEELLRRGADPNLVLEDGAAAIHLAARAQHPRSLSCLEALLRRGGDPNARSAEELTPLHVAAAWGCRRGLELLLSQGADPALRDQDGLRPLDLAELQGHQNCARVLRELETRTRTPTPTRADPQEPEPSPAPGSGSWGKGLDTSPSGTPNVTLDSTTPDRGDGKDMSLKAGLGPPSLLGHPATAGTHDSLESPRGHWDCSSVASFVTAVEASGAEDPTGHTSSCADVQPSQGVPRSSGAPPQEHRALVEGREAELSARMQALTLTLPDDSHSPKFFPDRSPTHNPPLEPLPEPSDFHISKDDQLSLDGDVAALWLTEDEASPTGGRDSVSSCQCPPDSTMSDRELLQELLALGKSPGPVTSLTRPYYLRRLKEAQAAPGPEFSGHSPELAEALRTGHIPDAQADEDALAKQFERPDPTRRWREGVMKSSFTYLLLDPRKTQDLPAQAFSLTLAECLRIFVNAIFYVGKGTRARPDVHLWEALSHRRRPGKQACPKVRRILDIWASGRGVVSLHCFQHVVPVEAYTREACLVDALGIQTLTNQKQGHCYGVVASWPPTRRRRLGVHLLHRALLVFLAEGDTGSIPGPGRSHMLQSN
ncbi:ankyrin repeat and LEM domain-containing protein 1 [Hippopotamus amphibius kiboko]|uniref:ankyrin repeat and LEM domain-containing protein 1 n=1 Tax=Hippopotamus amphibius kiboko TaxID=575201 RepID=UPI002594B3A2|nr:ankyrin repeat and LEM domain-containing protein 1 [Hippopotamus amphibius kiboko]